MIDNLMLGFVTVLTVHNLLYLLVGVTVGNLMGVLPGISALTAISMLLPITYGLDPTGAIMMLAGIYYGTSFGGATTSILMNLPGTASHAVVCLDGNPMARQGRAGAALFIAMFASFIGVCVGIVMMALFSSVLAEGAFLFGPSEYFALMLLGLMAAATLTTASPIKGVAAVVLGMILGVVGTDVSSGVDRFIFGIPELQDGLSLVALAMGLFGISDIFANAGRIKEGVKVSQMKLSSSSIRPSKGEIKESMPAIIRGSIIGPFFGILPGAGGTLASFISYALEKRISKTPERFGKGAIEGVAGPESTNSSAAITAFIPTLTLGIPGDAVMALILGALMIYNIQPGPLFMAEHPSLFWGLLVSFWLGNLMLLVLNIPLIGLWIKMLSVPYRLVYPIVLFLICIGVYSVNNNLFDVGVVMAFGSFGYLATKSGFEAAPVLLGFVLGPLMEENFRRALILSRGDLLTFFAGPISGGCMAIVFVLVALLVYRNLHQRGLSATA